MSAASFRLARPFVHGAASKTVEAIESNAELPPIGNFLDTTPELVESYGSQGDALDFTPDLQSSYDLPPVEHFLDPLPLVDSLSPEGDGLLAADATAPRVDGSPLSDDYQSESSEVFGLEETGWVDTGWQQFDWNGAAALGEGSAEASDAWTETDWETTIPPAREFRETAAQAIANALDEIAHRIRSGELAIPTPNLTTDPAAVAATLAALLGVRR